MSPEPLVKFVEIPITSGEAETILKGKQIAFTDLQRYEIFARTVIRHEDLTSQMYEIYMVRRLTLNYVSGSHYRENGYNSQRDFLRAWGSKHKDSPVNLKDKVFIHFLRRVCVDA